MKKTDMTTAPVADSAAPAPATGAEPPASGALSRRSVLGASSALALAALVGGASSARAATTGTQTVWVFGDSITVGGWLANPDDVWVLVLQRAAAPLGINVVNCGKAGMALHSPTGDANIALPHIKETFAANAARPDAVLVALGTNDATQHQLGRAAYDPRNIFYTLNAAMQVDTYLGSMGVNRVVWNTVYPFAVHAPTSFNSVGAPAALAPVWNQCADHINGWLNAMWTGRVLNTNFVLRDWPLTGLGATKYFLDGMHPTAEGHARIASSFAPSFLCPPA